MTEREPRGVDPIETFLRFALVTLEAGRLVLWDLDRRAEVWLPGREVRAPSWPAFDVSRLEAVGHPFTWAWREELLLQVPSRRVLAAASSDDWILVGPVPGGRRVLTAAFRGAPPVRARNGLERALRHLEALATLTGGSESR